MNSTCSSQSLHQLSSVSPNSTKPSIVLSFGFIQAFFRMSSPPHSVHTHNFFCFVMCSYTDIVTKGYSKGSNTSCNTKLFAVLKYIVVSFTLYATRRISYDLTGSKLKSIRCCSRYGVHCISLFCTNCLIEISLGSPSLTNGLTSVMIILE